MRVGWVDAGLREKVGQVGVPESLVGEGDGEVEVQVRVVALAEGELEGVLVFGDGPGRVDGVGDVD